jgi:hypothetical protein
VSAPVQQVRHNIRWLGPVCMIGVVINLGAAGHDLFYPTAWWSYLFGSLSLGCAGVCAWAWFEHRRLAKALKDLP